MLGDFCLDRYLEIDPAKREISLETGLPVHNVVRVRAQPGAAGTIVSNLAALGVGQILPVGFCGEDAEGFELQRALLSLPQAAMNHFFATAQRRTFTYTKPLLLRPGKNPKELNRLDFKNWSPTPAAVQQKIARAVRALAGRTDALIVLNQVSVPQTGVVTAAVLKALRAATRAHPDWLAVADSRRGLRDFPPLVLKMNAGELAAHIGSDRLRTLAEIKQVAGALARKNGRLVFVTLAQRGAVGAAPAGEVAHVPAIPVRGPIDIVGAGDAVTANLTVALGAGATLREALELANAAASVVIHQCGTTGTASVQQIRRLAVTEE